MNRFDDTISHEKRLELCQCRRQEIDRILTITMDEAEELDVDDGRPKNTEAGRYFEAYLDAYDEGREFGEHYFVDNDDDGDGAIEFSDDCTHDCHLCDSDTCEIRAEPCIKSEAEWAKYKKSWHKDLVRAEKRILKRLEKRYKQPYMWQP